MFIYNITSEWHGFGHGFAGVQVWVWVPDPPQTHTCSDVPDPPQTRTCSDAYPYPWHGYGRQGTEKEIYVIIIIYPKIKQGRQKPSDMKRRHYIQDQICLCLYWSTMCRICVWHMWQISELTSNCRWNAEIDPHIHGVSPSSIFVPAKINHRRSNYSSTICIAAEIDHRGVEFPLLLSHWSRNQPQEGDYPLSPTPGSSAPSFALVLKLTPYPSSSCHYSCFVWWDCSPLSSPVYMPLSIDAFVFNHI